MARSYSQEGSSLGRTWEANSSNSRHPIGSLMKCKHKTLVVYETCRKERNYGRKFFGCQFWKANDGCVFFVWEDELDKYLFEKNTKLEEMVEQLIEERTRLQAQNRRLLNGKTGNAELEGELNKLRGKLENEKRKRKAMREELYMLKQGGGRAKGLLKFAIFVIVVFVIVVNKLG